MKVLLVGSGGREHALAWKISQSPMLTALYCAPGNPGTSLAGQNIAISADDIDGLLDFARSESIDLTMVGPEAPLVEGIVDRFEAAGLAAAGPSSQAAQLEGSKAFAKDFMSRHGIPTARYRVYAEADQAESDLQSAHFTFPVVLKADGLAAGKGVLICQDLEQSLQALNTIMRDRAFGSAGDLLVIEEFLTGVEASFMVFSDGTSILPMVPSQDHKAIFENDRGPNTGGMGAYSVDSILSPDLKQQVMDQIIHPTIRGMAEEGNAYKGILYAGLMLTEQGPQVLEFNVRFGDPETQAVLPRLQSDLLEILWALRQGDLSGKSVSWSPQAVVCVVLASEGYPGSYEKGKLITGLSLAEEVKNTVVFHAGTRLVDGQLVTAGGRVLGVTASDEDLEAAIIRTYEGVNKISFEGMYYRRDIAAKGLRKSSS